MNASTMLNSLVSISTLNQGKAAKIISELGPNDAKVIIKNNEPMAAIVSIDRYTELLNAEEELLARKGDHNG